ncbi:MAG: D-glycerate dehydrogenase [Clostridia bacterium]|nr:D-glycerate dehydrogenase [Clostridia bacterium]
MKPKVYITYKIPEGPLKTLNEHCEVYINPEERPLTKQELCTELKGMDGVICMLSDNIDKEVIDYLKGVKIFANYAVGYNNIDFNYAADMGIAVTNTPGVLTNATADLAWALLFSVARCIVDSDRYTREGKFKGWAPTLYLGQDITGKTLGVIGAGRIGSNFARKAKGFDMKILYHNRKPNAEFEKETGAIYVDKETLLKEADFISVHAPLTAETKHMISYNEFRLMRKNAIIINTARGPIIDEKALVEALKNKQIWGAGLDVYENEPSIEPELFDLENVVLAPHIGSATTETREKMVEIAVANILAAFRGEVPPNCVNTEYRNNINI